MDLDEAIQHAKDVSLQCETTDPLCSAEHAQIALWLEELKATRASIYRGLTEALTLRAGDHALDDPLILETLPFCSTKAPSFRAGMKCISAESPCAIFSRGVKSRKWLIEP